MKRLIYILLAVFCFASCYRHDGTGHGMPENQIAVRYLYMDLDSAREYAQRGFDASSLHSSSHSMATNTLAAVAFAEGNMRGAEDLYQEVLKRGHNRIEQLVACVGMMEICQRVSDNVSFYEYRNRALKEVRSLQNEMPRMKDFELSRLAGVEMDMRIVSARYWLELEQVTQADRELSMIADDDRMRSDTVRHIKRNILRGTGLGIEENTPLENVQSRIRSLSWAVRTAEREGMALLKADAMLSASLLLLDTDSLLLAQSADLLVPFNPSGLKMELLPGQLALQALQIYLREGVMYDAVRSYMAMGSFNVAQADYSDAIEMLSKALDLLNDMRDSYWPEYRGLPALERYRFDDQIIENQWLEDIPLATVPECMSLLREQMSLAYSGLGDKVASDYNRNVYLELQKSLRLDRRYEARTALLKKSGRRLGITLVVLAGCVLAMLLLWLVPLRRIRRRNEQYVSSMEHLLALSERILSTVPESEGPELRAQLETVADSGVEQIGGSDMELKSMREALNPFIEAALQNAQALEQLGDRHRLMEKQTGLSAMHALENKRQNLIRKACYSAVQECLPLIDRLAAETSHLQQCEPGSAETRQRLDYIADLAGRLNEYNDVLAGWIKMRQGEVTMHVETFRLQQVFDIVEHSRRSFSRKGIGLEIKETDALVKADRALTLFMVNTLADNARKFTPQGGNVKIEAEEKEGYVEISVADTGAGMSEKDVDRILNEKVYNPSEIGCEGSGNSAKGSGFGLMNCRGIIDKYRKSGDVFNCCEWGIDSKKECGSRVWFRLPKGMKKVLSVLVMLLISVGVTYADEASDSLLVQAYDYAEKSYQANIDELYVDAIDFAALSLDALNADWLALGGDSSLVLKLDGTGQPAEMEWMEREFPTDYETVLWIRNEVAVAALALGDWNLYRYNNDAYLRLFRLYYSESGIEEDCRRLQRSNGNLAIGMSLVLLLLVGFILFRLIMYSRGRLRYRSDLQQLMQVMTGISDAVTGTDSSDDAEYNVERTAQRMLDGIWPKLSHLLPVSGASVLIASGSETGRAAAGNECPALADMLTECFKTGEPQTSADGMRKALPLKASDEDCVGAFALEFSGECNTTDNALIEMTARYMAVAVHSGVVRQAERYHGLEQLREESERLEYESDRLHVQNLVMDNCLSALKHETVYYPNRILQMAQEGCNGADAVTDMRELVSYYREVFGILASNAQRQSGDSLFRGGTAGVDGLFEKASAYLKKCKCGWLTLETVPSGLACSGDGTMLQILLENLIDAARRNTAEGRLTLRAVEDGDFVRIGLSDSRGCAGKNLENMFTPLGSQDSLEYVVSRQVIREHDEASGHAGCRINAEQGRDGELEIWFTVPSALNN